MLICRCLLKMLLNLTEKVFKHLPYMQQLFDGILMTVFPYSAGKILISPFEDITAFRGFSISFLMAHWPRVFRMLSVSHVNDSELHDQSHFEDLVCGSGLHGRQHTLMLLARSPVLIISTHTASRNLKCGFTSRNVAPSKGNCDHIGSYCLAFEEIINN